MGKIAPLSGIAPADGSPKFPSTNCNSSIFVNLAAAEFAFSLCHKVSIHLMSQSFHSSYVTKFPFVLCHKVCICPMSKSLHSFYVTNFAANLMMESGQMEFFNSNIDSVLCLAILTLLVIYKLTLLNCSLTQAGQDRN